MKKLALIAVIGALASTGLADPNYGGLFRVIAHEQTSASDVTATGAYIAAQLRSPLGEIGSATFGDGSASDFPLNHSVQNSQDYFDGGSPTFADVAAMDAVYPTNGLYSISYSGGTLGDGVVDFDSMDASYAKNAPKVSNFTELKNWDLSANLTIKLEKESSTYAYLSTLSSPLVFFGVWDFDTSSYVTGTTIFGDNTLSELPVDAANFTLGHHYQLGAFFSNRADFGGPTQIAWDKATYVDFTPVPEPASLIALSLGAVALLKRKRK